MTWDVTVGGTSVDALQDVTLGYTGDGELGDARVIAGNTQGNRNIDYSQVATISQNGTTRYQGVITKKPSLGRGNERIEFTVADMRAELKYIEAHRVFYQMDPGAIIRDAVNQEATVKSPVRIHSGSSTTGWSSDAPEFGTVSAQSKQLQEYGSDILGVGFPKGSSGVYTATYTGVPSNAIPGDGQILRLSTRVMANNYGDQIEGEVDLRDNAGNNYIWPLEYLNTQFENYQLRAEDAKPTAGIGTALGTDGALEYRFKLKGELPENRAVAIDHAATLPFTLSARSTKVSTSGVQDVGATVTRRFDDSVMAILAEFGQEYGYTSWVDSSDVLHFEPSGGTTAPFSITHSGTPVTSAKFNRDADQVVNKVTVQGSGDIQVTAVDNASVQYYGLSEREDHIVDKQIQTQAEARSRAEGYLADHAWSDVAFEFEIADSSYEQVRVAQAITISWPPQDISTSTWTVSKVQMNDRGLVTIGVTGSSA